VELHDRQVYSVSRRQAFATQHDFPGFFDYRSVHWEDFIDDSKQSIERWLNRIRPRDGDITVKDLLQYFGISRQPLSSGHQLFQPSPGIGFMRVSSAHEIHGDVRVDKNHGFTPDP
jgi:hypothetical protein